MPGFTVLDAVCSADLDFRFGGFRQMLTRIVSLQGFGLAIVLCGFSGLDALADDCCHDGSSTSTRLESSTPSHFNSRSLKKESITLPGKKILLGTESPVDKSLDSQAVRIQRPAVVEEAVFFLEKSPTYQFNTWLRLKIHPSLCQIVLCQRACALTEMPCSPLGVSAMRQYLFDRSSQGCCDAYEKDKSK